MKKITKFACMLLVMGGGLIGLSSCGGDDVPPVVQNPATPTGLTYESVTDVSAVLTWAGESTTYEVVVGSAAAVVVTGNSYTASGLTPETQYTWKVRAKDGDLYSDWVNGNPFTTAATIVEEDGWVMPSETAAEMSAYFTANMSTIDADGDGYTWRFANFTDGSGQATGEFGIVSNSWLSGGIGALEPDNYLLLPELTISSNAVLHVSLFATDADWYTETINVVISKNPLTSANCAGAEVLLNYTLTLPAKHTKDVTIPAAYNNGKVYLAVRHCNSTDVFNVVVGGLSMTNGSASAAPVPAPGVNGNAAPFYTPAFRK